MGILTESERESDEKIKRRECHVCIAGGGTIGLPVATLISSAGFQTMIFDVDKKRVESINKARVTFEYSNLLSKMINQKKLRATLDFEEAIVDSDILVVCVPTPITEEKEPDLSKLIKLINLLENNMKKGLLLIIESTVPIGTCRKIGLSIEEKSGFKIGEDFGISHVPERYNPILPKEKHVRIVFEEQEKDHFTLDKIPRVVGASDKKSLDLTIKFYSSFIKAKILPVSSLEAAEAVKITENVFRDVNIALMNELSKIYSALGLDSFEIIRGASSKPFAFLPHFPSLGVGGECIPVTPWFLIKQAEKMGLKPKLLKNAREINDSMPFYVADLLKKALEANGRKIAGSNIVILGVAYKANSSDTRLSPSLALIEIIKKMGGRVKACDPLVEKMHPNFGLTPLEKTFQKADALIMAVDHEIFKQKINLKKIKSQVRTPVIIDCRNFFRKEEVESLGFTYKGVGKPG
jgi:nucleotide sugar dehydrogenase